MQHCIQSIELVWSCVSQKSGTHELALTFYVFLKCILLPELKIKSQANIRITAMLQTYFTRKHKEP